jgi:hypothetical protein
MKLRCTLCACCLAAIALPHSVAAQNYTFTNIADSSGPSSGFFSGPKLNNGGAVSFTTFFGPGGARGADDASNGPSTLPLVAVFGRGKFAATLYGVIIHAEQVQSVLLYPDFATSLTGRFSLETDYTAQQDQCLELHVELAGGHDPNAELALRRSQVFVDSMRRSSSEYNRLYSEYGTRVDPVVCLHPYGDSRRFPRDRQTKVT